MSEEEKKEYWDKMGLEEPPCKTGNVTQSQTVATQTTTATPTSANPLKVSLSQNPADNESDKRFEAYQRAHDIRKFEIERFWQRSTYYWVFILAAFTAHFALLGLLFSTFSDSANKHFDLPTLISMPGLSLFALTITAFFCLFFSYCWVLMNKGSVFWQKNWETHINMLDDEFSGNLYKTFLATNYKDGDFSCCPLDLKAYDYSVSKITMLTSKVLFLASALLFLFYIVVFAFVILEKCGHPFPASALCWIKWIFGGIAIVMMFICIFSIRKSCLGNKKEQQKEEGKKTLCEKVCIVLCKLLKCPIGTDEKWVSRKSTNDLREGL